MKQPFVHYYDLHPTQEDLMGESVAQSTLIHYLLSVLTYLFRTTTCFIVSNLNLYQRRRRYEYPLAPDIALFKGVTIPNPAAREFRSWRLYEPNRPPPQVMFEFSAEETWKTDIEEKPARYAALGVQEYIAYDPNDPPRARSARRGIMKRIAFAFLGDLRGHLRGYRLNHQGHEAHEGE
ncbi:Uma2 family endonuclease [Roseiflexus castenholzii]|uniref:Uma2 family endonuclease n=1 Tax=Roseiflexus castenholzii TaxID=120962 RepID=UPI0018DE9EFB|nr:Uma2 family endonuclease [Roseiflexus castenholzii]